MKHPLIEFKHRCISDLAWMISSPPLISGYRNDVKWLDSTFFDHEYQSCLPHLIELDNHPEPFLKAIEGQRSHRLGIYFELLTEWWLRMSPNYDFVARNVAVRENGMTLGELDFVIKDKQSDRLIHLEVAVKFYLGYDPHTHLSDFHGPNLSDRLDIKYQRMLTHQTVLANNHPDLIPWEISERYCLLKGRLFYPPNDDPDNNQIPDEISPDHLHGQWLFEEPSDSTTRVLSKNEWLADTNYANDIGDDSHIIKHPQCFAIYKNDVEIDRFFLLKKDHWKQIKAQNVSI